MGCITYGYTHTHNLDSTITVYENFHYGKYKEGDFLLGSFSKYRLKDSLISNNDGLWRIDNDGKPVSMLRIENKSRDAFSLDGSEYLFEVSGKPDSSGYRASEIFSFNIAESSVQYEFTETSGFVMPVSSRGVGQPIFYMQDSRELKSYIVWKFDRETRQKTMLTDPKSPKRLDSYVLLRDSLIGNFTDSNGDSQYMTIDK